MLTGIVSGALKINKMFPFLLPYNRIIILNDGLSKIDFLPCVFLFEVVTLSRQFRLD